MSGLAVSNTTQYFDGLVGVFDLTMIPLAMKQSLEERRECRGQFHIVVMATLSVLAKETSSGFRERRKKVKRKR